MSSSDLAREPLDSDSVSSGATARPVHLRPAFILAVSIGGTIGTGARAALSLAAPSVDALPVVILAINVAGAFLLGWLLDALARRGPDVGRRRLARLLMGTGFCGGFTTYSSLASTTAVLLTDGAVAPAALYALVSVVIGCAAAWVGIACGGLARTAR